MVVKRTYRRRKGPLRTARRKPVYRKRAPYRRKKVSSVPRSIIPNRKFCQMRYCEKLQLSSPIGSYSIYRYQSSLFDPNLTGVGHQPLYHDQYAQLYQVYRVHGIKYNIGFVNSGSYPAYVLVKFSPTGNSTASSIEYEMERPTTKARFVLASTDTTKRNVYGYMSVPQVEGLSKKDFNGREEYEAIFGSSPTKVAKLEIMYEGISASTTINMLVELTYYVELSRRVDIGGS